MLLIFFTQFRHPTILILTFSLKMIFSLLSDFIRPICLPDLAENDLFNPDEVLYVTGWGWTIGCKS